MATSSRSSRARDESEVSDSTTARMYSEAVSTMEDSDASSSASASAFNLEPGKGTVRTFVNVMINRRVGFNRDDYSVAPEENAVMEVLGEADGEEGLAYQVRFANGNTELVAFEDLLSLENGPAALQVHEQGPSEDSDLASGEYGDMPKIATRQIRTRAQRDNDTETPHSSADDDDLGSKRRGPARRRRPGLRTAKEKIDFESEGSSEPSNGNGSESDDDQPRRSIRGSKSKRSRQSQISFENHNNRPRTRARFAPAADSDKESDEESQDDEDYGLLQSDVLPRKPKRRKLNQKPDSSRFVVERTQKVGSRRSERSTRPSNYALEMEVDDLERSEDDEPAVRAPPKAAGAREVFKALPRGNKFRERHMQVCDTCQNSNNSAGQLIYCQGCILAYHKSCLGPRSHRESLVTKVGDEEFVLQCRRCVNCPKKKDKYAPDLAKCQDCGEAGLSCAAFRSVKTSQVEQNEREENDGQDPITVVDPSRINNANNVLFRCTKCARAFHLHHLEPRSLYPISIEEDNDQDRAASRFLEYSKDWECKDCVDMPAKLGGLIAWRPDDTNNYTRGQDVSIISEDDKEYLVKWENLSYFRAKWMPGAWVWGVAAGSMRRAFFNKALPPKLRTEDAIPEEWLRIDIVLDVKYTNKIDAKTYDIDKARIKEVDQALIKYKGLGYEDAVWETVPGPDDGDRWTDFVVAYNDWVLGRYTNLPSISHLRTRIEKIRSGTFKNKSKQPDKLDGGELMNYQLDGMNWMYYNWHKQTNGILADEMGLGKTIQVIAFLAMMVHDIKCFPFLIVVPNSTCPNWRREIKRWAPQLRVVTYYGSATAREMAKKYELFPDGSKSLKCHAVITSYDAVVDVESRRLFKSVQWQGLIVDEGQRLKNDESQLHLALNSLKVPFRILLTGTPLQNNARELFNLLQFIDDKVKAAELDEEFAEMTNEKIVKLHSIIKPYILRRTKLQVLSFLPPMAQIILPVSMSVLQKKTYMGIIEQKPELLRSLFSTTGLKKAERVGLNNILMQLRKCLCHPFVFNMAIEERELDRHVTHQNLVEASGKLQLLEVLLPKLQQRGHRVLIFSQFLNMLDIVEDFLEGMALTYQRLDGQINSLEKQKRIDEFNSPTSSLFAFLLSTRAGGVGINLATADTVIILDPDFNPHQDIQAISRAHRIGQTKKVLCFQLMTRNSAEEKIMQIGRKKMALDEVVINNLDDEDVEDKDMESILRHGVAELFNDDNQEQNIRYDDASVEKLLDRSQLENTKANKENTAESQFSFARIWENDEAALQESLDILEVEERPPDKSFWEKILKDRETKAAAEAAEKVALGRGQRRREAVDYKRDHPHGEDDDPNSPEVHLDPVAVDKSNRKRKGPHNGDDSDTDFHDSDRDGGDSDDEDHHEPVSTVELNVMGDGRASSGAILGAKNSRAIPATFARSNVQPSPMLPSHSDARMPNGKPYPKMRVCPACFSQHPQGSCPLKLAPLERCNICGMAHFGFARVCPHFRSETMVRIMLESLKTSPEPKYLIDHATKYLRGLKGSLVQEKKRAMERALGKTANGPLPPLRPVNEQAGPSNGHAVHRAQTLPTAAANSQQEPVPFHELPVEDRLRLLTSNPNY